MKYLNFVHPVA